MARKPGTKEQLAKYRSMRDFKKTKEPAGSDAPKRDERLSYLIQKHDATRLHYDFRLELDGVLKSWAVTRGPSMNPEDKRLAVRTEDHPLEYGTFEGTIPAGQYGGGTVMLWDRGHWEPVGDARRGIEKGKLHFRLFGERLQGEWVLLKMRGRAQKEKRENWLLIKVQDDFTDEVGDRALQQYTVSVESGRAMDAIQRGDTEWKSGKARKKKPAKPTKLKAEPAEFSFEVQLATLVDEPPKGEGWVHELKFDGYRAVAIIQDGSATLMTRAGNDWTHKFRSIARAFSESGIVDAVIDGEIVAPREDGTMRFHDLQQALSKDTQKDLRYYAFDLLYADGKTLLDTPLAERKEMLRELLPGHPCIHYSEHFTESGIQVLKQACGMDFEGIISKRADAPYRGGRGRDWLKSKCISEQEFVVGGYITQENHPSRLGALLIGYFEDGAFRFAGKVGTGFTSAEGSEIMKRLQEQPRESSPFSGKVPAHQRKRANWVEPELVAQVRFGEWTEAGMLRHPSFEGLREDKPARQVVREMPEGVDKPEPARKSKPTTRKKRASAQPRTITLTHPDRILYPDNGITKQQLAEYYLAVAPHMLPHVAERPVSLMRCPEGLNGSCFFQRHPPAGMPEGITGLDLGEEEPFMVLHDAQGLLAAVQMGGIEFHTWGAPAQDVEHPDRIVLDFDPDPGVAWKTLKDGVAAMHEMLGELKLESFLKTTGGKGLHVVIPFAKGPSWEDAKRFSQAVSQLLLEREPKLYTLNSSKAARKGKIYLDYLRNERAASAVAPYSARAREGAPVAMPIGWDELGKLKAGNRFTVGNALAYLKKRKSDPWAGMEKLKQKLPL